MSVHEKGLTVGRILAQLNPNMDRETKVRYATDILCITDEDVDNDKVREEYYIGVGEGYAEEISTKCFKQAYL